MSKSDFYRMHTELCKAIFNPKRLIIIDALREKEMKVLELAGKTGISQSNLSHHLSMLKSKGVLSVRRDKTNVFYSIDDEKITKAIDLISDILKHKLIKETELIEKAV